MNSKHIHNEPYVILSKVKDLLGYSDMRSVIAWCEKNGVFVIQQRNQKIVNTTEFILSFYKPFIQHLKSKHTNWKERFVDYLEGNVKNILSDMKARIPVAKPVKKKKNQTSFLQTLKDL